MFKTVTELALSEDHVMQRHLWVYPCACYLSIS